MTYTNFRWHQISLWLTATINTMTFRIGPYVRFITCLGIIHTSADVLSQGLISDFLTPAVQSASSLSHSQAEKIRRIEKSKTVRKVHLVTVGKLQDFQHQGNLS